MNRWKQALVGWMVAFALVGCEGGGGDVEQDDTLMPGEDAPVSSEATEEIDLGVAQQALPAAAFGPLQVVPTGLSNEGPAVMSRGTNIDAYVRGLDNQMYYGYWSSITGWLNWSAQGGIFSSKPSATSIANNSGLAVVGRGLDSHHWIKVSLPPAGGGHPVSPGGWQRIPGRTFVQAPAIAFLTDTILVFGIGTNNAMYVSRNRLSLSGSTWTYNHGSWTPWQSLGGVFYSEPAATVTPAGRLWVAGRGTDRRFWWARSFNGVNYSGWTPAPSGIYSSGPALVARGAEVNLFGRGLDGAYWISTSVGGNFGNPGRINGGVFDSSPGATVANGRVYLFGTGLDERIYYRRAN